jgi:Asp-tRNA(Asn)/Glu-tRNA(Gln) amidotransferase A subunit family amidase
VLTQSPSLDTVGVFARCVADAAMLCDVLFGHDPLDTATRPAPPPRILAATLDRPPVPPVFAFVRPPGWNTAEEATRAALGELVAALGEQCFEAPLPNAFDEAAAIRERINLAEMAKCYFTYERRGRDALSESMLEAIDAGKQILARDYIAALDWPHVLYAGLAQIFERCDAIIAPASLGPAPKGLSSTGSPIFNGLWTLVGTPAITLPVFKTDDGLPMGVQVVGRRGDDARLLRTARWLMDRVTGGAPAQERGT